MRNHVMRKVGNGKTMFFWHDRWWEGGVISEMVTNDIVNSTHSDGKDKVSDIVENGKWKL